MARLESFEELIAWQKARVLSSEIYRITKAEKFRTDFPLVNQIRRASTSVMSNIAEGFERGGRAEFHQYLVVAKGSCAEVRSQLYVALDVGYLGKDEFQKLYDSTAELGRIIGGLRASVDTRRRVKKQ